MLVSIAALVAASINPGSALAAPEWWSDDRVGQTLSGAERGCYWPTISMRWPSDYRPCFKTEAEARRSFTNWRDSAESRRVEEIGKLPADHRAAVRDRKLMLGVSRRAMELAWGTHRRCSTTQRLGAPVIEQCWYDSTMITIEDGIVVGISG